jgi:hypothetical protein
VLAHSNVSLSVGLGIPAPVYVAPAPVYYAPPPPPVYYYGYYQPAPVVFYGGSRHYDRRVVYRDARGPRHYRNDRHHHRH